MTGRPLAAALLAVVLLGAACESDVRALSTTSSASTLTDGPSTSGEILVTYIRSGGIAGARFQVVVRPDGTFEGGGGASGRGQLGGAALDQLRGLVAAFAAAEPAPAYGATIPDGFTTNVAAGGVSTSVTGEATPPPAVRDLIGFLAALERQLPR